MVTNPSEEVVSCCVKVTTRVLSFPTLRSICALSRRSRKCLSSAYPTAPFVPSDIGPPEPVSDMTAPLKCDQRCCRSGPRGQVSITSDGITTFNAFHCRSQEMRVWRMKRKQRTASIVFVRTLTIAPSTFNFSCSVFKRRDVDVRLLDEMLNISKKFASVLNFRDTSLTSLRLHCCEDELRRGEAGRHQMCSRALSVPQLFLLLRANSIEQNGPSAKRESDTAGDLSLLLPHACINRIIAWGPK